MPILDFLPLARVQIRGVADVQESQIQDGKAGNITTLDLMKKLAVEKSRDPRVRHVALAVLQQAGVGSQNYVKEALAIGRYVQQYCRYVQDARTVEQVHDPVMLLSQIAEGRCAADCDDQATLIAALLLSIGHDPAFRAVRWTSKYGPYNHVYVVDYTNNWGQPKQRVVLDAILKRSPIGTEYPHQSGDEYPVYG